MKASFLVAVRKELLEKASELVPNYGFANASLFHTALGALQEKNEYKDNKSMADVDFAQLFPRGFPIALVEHIVENTNKAAHVRLEESFNKNTILDNVAKNSGSYQVGQYKLPGVKNVVEEAISTKIKALQPYVEYWPEAVALELKPANVPFAVKNLSEFVDNICYYAERMENLGAVIASGNLLLQSRLYYPTIHRDLDKKGHERHQQETDEERFWRGFSSSIPLSSGPHVGGGLLNYDWYIKRTKVLTVFSLAMFSFVGEGKGYSGDTRAMIRCIIDTLL
ncbi:putative COQ9 [Trypanosoma cruzi]|uniref:Ubiquinone biosynthesis protein n=1 Tax=Trypanosoma cruzi TaxID=5693 RepID=A0A2V2X212_TRYCR|nr:putative COQ9 [Trypanosoma cruzi]